MRYRTFLPTLLLGCVLGTCVEAAGMPNLGVSNSIGERSIERLRAAGAKLPKNAEQARAKYETDRLIQSATYAMKGEDWKRCRQLLDQAQQQLESAALLDDEQRRTFALIDSVVAFGLGETEQAGALIEGYVEELANLPSVDRGDLAFGQAIAAICRVKSGDVAGAVEAAKKSIEQYRASPPKGGDVGMLPTMWTLLAYDAQRRKDTESGAAHQRAACQAYVDADAANTVEYAEALELLSRFESLRQDFSAGRRCLAEALAIFERTVGRDDPRTKKTAEQLSVVVMHFAELDRQKALVREYEEISQRRAALDMKTQQEEHRKLIERELEIVRSLPGVSTDDMFTKLWEVGNDRLARKDHAGAEQLFVEARKLLKETSVGNDASYRLVLLHRLGTCSIGMNNQKDAKARFEDCLKEFVKSPTAPPQVAACVKQAHLCLVMLAANEEDSTAVVRHGRQALELLQKEKEDSAEQLNQLQFIVALHRASIPGERATARREFADFKESYLKRHGANPERSFDFATYEITFLYRCEDERCVDMALDLCDAEKANGHCDDTRIIDAELAAATCLRAFGREEDAERMLEDVLMKSSGPDKESRSARSAALFLLAGIYAHQGLRSETEQSYGETIEVFESSRGAHDPRALARRREWEAYQKGRLPSFAPKDNPIHVVLSLTAD